MMGSSEQETAVAYLKVLGPELSGPSSDNREAQITSKMTELLTPC